VAKAEEFEVMLIRTEVRKPVSEARSQLEDHNS
jgi:hypothetical protein